MCYDAVPSEFVGKITKFKDGSERFEKEEFKEEESPPTKRSRRDQGQSRETSWHNVRQEIIEPRQLGEISSTAEIRKENKSSEVYVQRKYCTKKADWEQFSADVGKNLAD